MMNRKAMDDDWRSIVVWENPVVSLFSYYYGNDCVW